MTELVTVQLLEIPGEAQRRSADHHDALRREFQVIQAGDNDAESVPSQLTTVIEEMTAIGERARLREQLVKQVLNES